MLTPDDIDSIDSKELASKTFFGEQALATVPSNLPSHTSSITWKSQAIKDKEEFERVRQRVRQLAPEQFKTNAKPGRGRSEIFPQNVGEWLMHKKEVIAMAGAENKKDCDLLKAKIAASEKIPKTQRKIVSVFGGDGGKVFKDGYSPVLYVPTIWSAEYLPQTAPWPLKGEILWNGDSRQSHLAKTKCGRFLPPPRAPASPTAPLRERPFIRQFPFDETGPVFASGPRPDEICNNNVDMNYDPAFEALGNFYLGSVLMEEVGEWKPPFVPEWRNEQLAINEGTMVVWEEASFVGTPTMSDNMWYQGATQLEMWDQQPVWW